MPGSTQGQPRVTLHRPTMLGTSVQLCGGLAGNEPVSNGSNVGAPQSRDE